MNPVANANTISSLASLIGDPARANILSALMGGKALTAGELAYCASVRPQTASSHLAKLLDGELIAVEQQGRHRYYRIASPAVAEAFENLSSLAATAPRRQRVTGPKDAAMRQARTCYDHMAGRLAVAITDSLVKRRFLILEERLGVITDEGRSFLSENGIDWDAGAASRRPLCRTCVDWSERRMHLAGRLGATLLSGFMGRNWVNRSRHDHRTLVVTRAGETGFREIFGISRDVLSL